MQQPVDAVAPLGRAAAAGIAADGSEYTARLSGQKRLYSQMREVTTPAAPAAAQAQGNYSPGSSAATAAVEAAAGQPSAPMQDLEMNFSDTGGPCSSGYCYRSSPHCDNAVYSPNYPGYVVPTSPGIEGITAAAAPAECCFGKTCAGGSGPKLADLSHGKPAQPQPHPAQQQPCAVRQAALSAPKGAALAAAAGQPAAPAQAPAVVQSRRVTPPTHFVGSTVEIMKRYNPDKLPETCGGVLLTRLIDVGTWGAVYEGKQLVEGSPAAVAAAGDGGNKNSTSVAVKVYSGLSKGFLPERTALLHAIGMEGVVQVFALGGLRKEDEAAQQSAGAAAAGKGVLPGAGPSVGGADGAPGGAAGKNGDAKQGAPASGAGDLYPCLIMELCSKGSLEGPTLHSEPEASRTMSHVLKALAQLHALGITHRDLKAGNVMLRDDGLPVIADFGSADVRKQQPQVQAAATSGQQEGGSSSSGASQLEQGHGTGSSNGSGSSAGSGGGSGSQQQVDYGPSMSEVVGTPLYMVPQMGNRLGNGMYNRSADSYSCGVLTVSLMCGGWRPLKAAAIELAEGVSQQKSTLRPWLSAFANGEEDEALPVSAELRDFVRCCTELRQLPAQLLQHPWITKHQQQPQMQATS